MLLLRLNIHLQPLCLLQWSTWMEHTTCQVSKQLTIRGNQAAGQMWCWLRGANGPFAIGCYPPRQRRWTSLPRSSATTRSTSAENTRRSLCAGEPVTAMR